MNESPKGVVLYFGGMHTLLLGLIGAVLKKFVEALGWKFFHCRYPDHEEGQAQEGFTMERALKKGREDLAGIRKTFPGLPIILAGNSLGGWVASLLAAHEDVHGLLLLNPSMNFVSEYLRKKVRTRMMRWLVWFWYAHIKPFKYYVPKADGSRMNHYIPHSFLLDVGMNDFDVLEFTADVQCPVLAVLPCLGNEGFLASPEMCERFCDAVKKNGQFVQTVNDDSVAHGGNGQFSEWVRFPLDGFLERIAQR